MPQNMQQERARRKVVGSVLERALSFLGHAQGEEHIADALVLEDPEVPWTQWFSQVAYSLEMAPAQLDITLDELSLMVQHRGGVWVTSVSNGSWLVVGYELSGRLTATHFTKDGDATVVMFGALGNVLGAQANAWVFLESQLHMQELSRRGLTWAGAKKAVSRFRSLLLSERDAVAAVLVYAVFMGVVGLLTPLAVQALVNTISFGMMVQPLVVLAIVLLAGLTFVGSLRVMQHVVVEHLQRRLFVRFMSDLAVRLPRASQKAHERYHMSELVNRFFDVVTVQKSLALLLLDSLGVVLQMVLGMLVLAFYHPYLLAFDVLMILAVLFVVFILGRGAVSTSLDESDAKYAVAAWLEEIASHPMSFKSTHGRRFAQSRANRLAMNWLGARSSHFHVLMRQIVGAVIVQALFSAAILGLGGWLVLKGQLTLGQLVAAEIIVTAVAASVGKMGKHLETYYDTVTGVHKMGKVLDIPLEHMFGEAPKDMGRPVCLELKQVRVDCGMMVSDHLELLVEPGERVGLTGDNNSTLSALIEAIFGLRTPTCGTILFDGVAHNEWSVSALRDHIALVRDVDVFEGTIEENMRLGRREISPAEIRDALQRVGLLEELRMLPESLDTRLKAHGIPLSTDQLERLMIARAIVQRPRMILIDRALDHMHPLHMPAVLDALFDSTYNWTLVVVSHQADVLARAGRLIRLTPHGINRMSAMTDGEAE